jgi:hypothetical protein
MYLKEEMGLCSVGPVIGNFHCPSVLERRPGGQGTDSLSIDKGVVY